MMRLRRGLAATLASGLMLTAGTQAASAAAQHPMAMPGRAHALSRMGALSAVNSLLPQASPPRTRFLTMYSRPEPVVRQGTQYWMSTAAFGVSPAFGSSAQMEVDLIRTLARRGRAYAEQSHSYLLAPPAGFVFKATGSLQYGRLNSRGSVNPDKVDLVFRPSAPVQSGRCTLVDGGHGRLQVAEGTLRDRAFRIFTGSTPFFGTLRTAPTEATLLADPGCSGGVIVQGAQPRFLEPCTGRETLTASSPDAVVAAEIEYGGQQAIQVAATSTAQDQPTIAQHEVAALTAPADLPHPDVRTDGATARILTAGDPFMQGAAVFHSEFAPRVSRGHLCTTGAATRRFTVTRYRGTLEPAASSPLEALFDTGATGFQPMHATLVLRSYA